MVKDPRTARVGVLALQGDFARHGASLEALGATVVPVRLPEHLAGLDALVLPGGESTTMLRLMESSGLRQPLADFVRERPVLGTCAGVILLGAEAAHLPHPPFAALDITVERNAYGRQIDSFSAEIEAPVVGGRFHAVFIRAPRIGRVGAGVEVVAWRGAGAQREPVGVRSGRVVGLCFHPELTADLGFHRWFLGEVACLPALTEPGAVPAVAGGARRAAAEVRSTRS
jgi:5'-phosphate synthase pdxT subunit